MAFAKKLIFRWFSQQENQRYLQPFIPGTFRVIFPRESPGDPVFLRKSFFPHENIYFFLQGRVEGIQRFGSVIEVDPVLLWRRQVFLQVSAVAEALKMQQQIVVAHQVVPKARQKRATSKGS